METRPFTFDEAELRLRRLLAEEGYGQPDEVRKGPAEHEITFAWDGHDRPIRMDLRSPRSPPRCASWSATAGCEVPT